jgi:predicted nucleotidyltransferase
MDRPVRYPSAEHEEAAREIVEFFASTFDIDAVLLVNSCARGKATRDSCLDLVVLTKPASLHRQQRELQAGWDTFNGTSRAIAALREVGRYSVVHLDFIDGVFAPYEREEASGPDDFELWIGNFVAYSVPLWQGTRYFSELRHQWLPYYEETLRHARLKMVRHHCLNNLHHIPLYVERGLYFQAFDRLYNAYREFLQALFIAQRTYPIAYNKWIREQVVEILGLPDLYAELPHLLEIPNLQSTATAQKAKRIEQLLEEYAPRPGAD